MLSLADERDEGRVPLRLSATRGVLGLELYEAIEVGPLEVRALSVVLPGLAFPLDLTGGVPVFRHRRGDLERVELVLGLSALARWLEPRLANIVGALERSPQLWSVPQGFGLGLSGARGALAFELLWAPLFGDARFVVSRARGVGLDEPALATALRAVDSLFAELGERRGRIFTIPRVAARLGRIVLPAIGARAPASSRVRFGELEIEGDEARLELDATFEPPALHASAARALELAELTCRADDALSRGELDAARADYLTALERAPRHPEITQLVGEIDLFSAGRAEAALGLIVESLPAQHSGVVGAELLARTGDYAGASSAIEHMLESEPFAPLAALLWQRLSELAPTAPDRRTALDRAVAAAPGLARVRWERFAARVEWGDVAGASADAEHLEAAVSGAAPRHDACSRVARALMARGFVKDAGRWFERALRYVPDDPAATAGLARSLMEAGKGERAFALLSRAVALAERAGQSDADALVDMARLLATELGDLPQAIARIRQVRQSSPRAVEALALEAEWRAGIGDVAGASLAYARMRDRIELSEPVPDEAVRFLTDAARFCQRVENDPWAAERHLAVALRLAPRDRAIGEAYRVAAAQVAARARREHKREAAREEPIALETVPPPPAENERRDSDGPAVDTLAPASDPALAAEADPVDVALAERLSSALASNPEDDALALELADVLGRMGKDHELYALLSARLDDTPEHRREDVRERLVWVLTRLGARATQEGRLSEAMLYQTALAELGSR